jgi:hypothetical protein
VHARWPFFALADLAQKARRGVHRMHTPATDVLHIHRKRRRGQLRDVSWLTPVLTRLRDLGGTAFFCAAGPEKITPPYELPKGSDPARFRLTTLRRLPCRRARCRQPYSRGTPRFSPVRGRPATRLSAAAALDVPDHREAEVDHAAQLAPPRRWRAELAGDREGRRSIATRFNSPASSSRRRAGSLSASKRSISGWSSRHRSSPRAGCRCS